MKKSLLVAFGILASASAMAHESYYCQGNTLRELSTGKDVRYVYSDDAGGCASALKSSRGGYYCAGNTLRELATGKNVRYVYSDDAGGCTSALGASK